MNYSTFSLTKDWDLGIDSIGNLSFKVDSQATAQDVASACAIFKGEIIYDKNAGINYQTEVLGKPYNAAMLTANIEKEAARVSSVKDVVCSILFDRQDRACSIRILTTDKNNEQQEVIL